MFVIHRAAQGAVLASRLADVLRTAPRDPLAAEVVAVPAKGVERWLAQRLSHVLGAGSAGDGVCANVRFPAVSTLIDEVLALVSPVDAVDAWRPDRLVWPLLDELDACVPGESWCLPLTRHLGTGVEDKGRRLGIARKLAGLYDSYAQSRPQMLRDWAAGADEQGDGTELPADLRWQAELWRRLRERVQQPSSAELLEASCDVLRRGGPDLPLPDRLSVFGASRLSTARLQVLGALAAQRDVHLWLHHPSPALWTSVADAPKARRRAEDSTARNVHNPLLASLSRDVREFQQLLAATVPEAQAEEHTSPAPPATLLGALQARLLTDAGDSPTLALDSNDRTVQVHACHGRTRQVEVLREVVLGLLEADRSLEPRDVLVMCPDVETFAPLIAATFAIGAESSASHPAARLRVRLADRALRQTNPLLASLSLLLELATARVTSSQVLDLAGTAGVRQRFGFDDEDLERLADWAAASGVRWGLDAEHRGGWHLGGLVQGTWREGLDRLLLGAVTEGSADDVTPLDDVDSAAIDLAGRFCELVDRLGACVSAMSEQHTAAGWADLLEHGVLSLAAAAPDAGWQELQLRAEIGDLREASEGSQALLRLQDIRGLFADTLAGRPTRASFRTGTLTVCTLVPMRSVPHRVVCLLGLDDGAFPRQSLRDGDDVLARSPWVGERDPGSEDRQLLLDAICAAGEHLVVTYTGADSRTGAAVPPAVPLGELLDALDSAALVQPGRPRVRDVVTTHHPLQPFDARNFTAGALGTEGPFSFDPISYAAALSAAGPRTPPAPLLVQPLTPAPVEDVSLVELLKLLEHPARGFLRQRLDVAIARAQEDAQDALPLELSDLERYAVAERLLHDRLRGLDRDVCRRRELRRGILPPGQLGEASLVAAEERSEQVVAASAAERALDPEAWDVDVSLGDGTRLVGTVSGVRGTVLLSTTCASLSGRHRLRAWVQLVALAAAHPQKDWRAVSVGRSGQRVARSVLGPLDPDLARAVLTQLVALYRTGLAAPLPLPVKTAAQYAFVRARGRSVELARSQASKTWDDDRYPGECSDSEHVLLYGAQAPLAALTSQLPQPHEGGIGWPTEETDRFGLLACHVWQPLLDHETTIVG